MKAELYWIADVPNGRLAVMPRPRAGDWLEDEAASWRRDGLDVIVSLLEETEIEELGLEDEPRLCREAGLDFRSFPVPDRGVPESKSAFAAFIAELNELLQAGKAVGLHCRMGVGRSAVVAACVLQLQGVPPKLAFERIAQTRGMSVPDTSEQIAWVERFVG